MQASPLRRLSGHLRTIRHLLGNLLLPPPAPPAERWRGSLEDPHTGRIEVSGWHSKAAAGETLVILIHGLGGSADSPYLCYAAKVAAAAGIATLRLNLRGADPAAGDFYHGGLTAELHAAVADRAFAGCRRIAILGYSMGGHVALRFAAETDEPRVTAVAAVCSPLHLAPVSESFDLPSRALYRFWVLRHLRRGFAALERAGAVLPSSYDEIRRARSFSHWDALTVVRRYGFADPADYYRQASASAVLGRLRVPCLLVASRIDPVITVGAIEPYLPPEAVVGELGDDLDGVSRRRAGGGRPAAFTLLWHPDAGHVGFPRRVRLEARLLRWLLPPA